MAINTDEIRALYEEHKSIRAVVKAYNKGKTKQESISRKQAETIIHTIREKEDKTPPMGVVFFAILIIGSSLIHMHTLIVKKDWYWEVYAYYPGWLIALRYSFSWLQRIVGLSVAAGTLLLNNMFRKLAIILGMFTIATVYLKHPYTGFARHTAILDEQYGSVIRSFGIAEFSFQSLTVAAMIVHWLLDIGFWCFWIWYFTRPHIKEYFGIAKEEKAT